MRTLLLNYKIIACRIKKEKQLKINQIIQINPKRESKAFQIKVVTITQKMNFQVLLEGQLLLPKQNDF